MNDAAPLNRYQLAELGSLLAEPARAAMLLALTDGTSRPAGELAQAEVAISTMVPTAHSTRRGLALRVKAFIPLSPWVWPVSGRRRSAPRRPLAGLSGTV